MRQMAWSRGPARSLNIVFLLTRPIARHLQTPTCRHLMERIILRHWCCRQTGCPNRRGQMPAPGIGFMGARRRPPTRFTQRQPSSDYSAGNTDSRSHCFPLPIFNQGTRLPPPRTPMRPILPFSRRRLEHPDRLPMPHELVRPRQHSLGHRRGTAREPRLHRTKQSQLWLGRRPPRQQHCSDRVPGNQGIPLQPAVISIDGVGPRL